MPRCEVRDPCIIREGDTYYLVFTMYPFRNREEKRLSEPNQGGSPGIALYSSKDLKAWKFESWLVKSSELPENCPYKNRFWAPEIHKIGGKFYLIFTADNWLKNEYNPAGRWGTAGYAFVGVANRVTGPYEHITWIKGGACDTTLFGDSDGRTYVFIPRGNVDMQEIDLRGLTSGEVNLVGQPKRVIACSKPTSACRPARLPRRPLDGADPGQVLPLLRRNLQGQETSPSCFGYRTGVAYADTLGGSVPEGPARQGLLRRAPWPCSTGRTAASGSPIAARAAGRRSGKLCIDPLDVDAKGRIQAANH